MKRRLPKDYAIIYNQSLFLDGSKDFCHNDKQRDLYKQASELLKQNKMHPPATRSPAPRARGSNDTLGTP